MFSKINAICDRHRRALDMLFYIGFTLNIFYFFLRRTMFYVFMDALPWMGLLGISLLMLLISALNEIFRSESKMEVIFDLALHISGALQYVIGGHYPIQFFMVIVMIAARRKDAKKCLMAFVASGTFILIFVWILSLNGIIYYQTEPNLALGTSNSTDCMADWFFVISAYLVFRRNKVKWFEYPILYLWTTYIFYLTKGRTAAICLYAVLTYSLIINIKTITKTSSKSTTKPYRALAFFDFSYVYAFIFSFIAGIFFSELFADKLTGSLNTIQSRLILTHKALISRPFSLFGSHVNEAGFGGNHDIGEYFFIDNSYVRIYVMLGAVMAFLLFYAITGLAIEARKGQMWILYGILVIISVDCIMEHHFAEYWCNIIISLALADWGFLKLEPDTECHQ